MKFNVAYGERNRVRTDVVGDSMAVQAEKDACDVNKIVERYDRTGVLTHARELKGVYGDFTQANDFKSAMDIIMDAESAFMALPSDLRTMFDNDVSKYFEFVNNPDNLDVLHNLGLADKPDNVAVKDDLSSSHAKQVVAGTAAGAEPKGEAVAEKT